MNFVVPEELFYTTNHEWLNVDETLVTLGLTDFRVDQLGEILYLDLPEEGDTVNSGQVFSSIESIKSIHDFISPVSGTVIEVNHAVIDEPGTMNDDPFNEGWLMKVEMDHEKDLTALLRADEYKKLRGLKVQQVKKPEYTPNTPEVEPDDADLDENDDDEDDDES